MRPRTALITSLVALITIGAIWYLAKSSPDSGIGGDTEQPTLRLAVAPFHDTTITLVGINQGFFEDEGIRLEPVSVDSWEAQYDLLAGGGVDMIMSTLDEFVNKSRGLENTGKPVVYFLPAWQYTGLAFFIDKDLKTLSELRESYSDLEAKQQFLDQLVGKKVAFPEGSVFETAFNQFVLDAGRKESEFTTPHTETVAGVYALRHQGVAMAAVGAQQIAEAKRRGFKQAIPPKDLGLVIITGFVARNAILQENESALKAFIKGWYRTVEFTKQNPKQSYEVANNALESRGANTTSYEEYVDLRSLNVLPSSPDETTRLFLEPEGGAYWKQTWDQAVGNLRESDKISSIPESTSGFVAQKIVGEIDQ